MRYLTFCLLTVLAISCNKMEMVEPDSLESNPKSNNYFTTFWELKQTDLINLPWNDGAAFKELIYGTWEVLLVIAIDEEGEIQHHDYTVTNLEYRFGDYCRYVTPSEFACAYTSTNPIDAEGIYGLQSTDDNEQFYARANEGSTSTSALTDNFWGNIYQWPEEPNVLVIANETGPHWIFMRKVESY